MHHSIEETYIFPLLAPKLPSFGTKDPVHIREHQAMHEKLEDLERYTRKVAQDLESSLGRKSIADGCGKEVPRGTSDDEEQGDIRRKPWPTTLYDADRYTSILTQLGATLFPHLESEEKSLRGNNLKEHGLTLQEISAIPM